MKPKHVFWGLFLVLLGILILLSNFSVIDIHLGAIWKFWPIVIILWGVSYIVNRDFIRILFAAVSAIILALVVFGAGQSFLKIFNKHIDFEITNDKRYSYADTTKFVESFKSNIKYADLKIDGGVGSFNITEPTDDLISITALGDKSDYSLTRKDFENNASVDFIMTKTKIKLNKKSMNNKVQLSLNPTPIWNMNINLDAADIDFDLTPYKISSAKFDVGAASLEIKIGDKYPETIMDFDFGASSVKIWIPDSSGCEIRSNVALSSKHFENFKNIERKLFRTENFESSKNKIYLRLDGAVSSVEVQRFSKEW